ncbi:MAG: SIS domain-containing protein [Propionibacteriaceae bacterium]|nr:SIS domain-containing protein [Propionibacteriaceae bacterium]
MTSMMATLAERYYADLRHGLETGPPPELRQIAERLLEAVVNRQRVFAFGNGASAALAAHMACDLGKGSASDSGARPGELPYSARLAIMSLPDNAALTTAYGNDVAFGSVFAEPLKNLLDPGDVVIGISGSGNSPNVLAAMEYGRARGATTIAFTGMMPGAARLAAWSDIVLQAPSTIIEQIEDFHVCFHHIIGLMLRQALGTAPALWVESDEPGRV